MIRDETEEESKLMPQRIMQTPTLFLKEEKLESTEDFSERSTRSSDHFRKTV